MQVISERDGVAYALRRLDNVRATSRIASAAHERWSTACPAHPNLVRLERCFMDSGSKALFFCHAYWPTSQTLAERYINSRQPVGETLLWSYLTQLSSALRVVHVSGLAVRCLSPVHVLVTSGSRVRIGGLGVVDVVEYDQVKTVAEQQREDLVSLGQTLLTVACRTFVDQRNLQACLATVAQQYSRDMVTVLQVSP